jgi:hypothetical protein
MYTHTRARTHAHTHKGIGQYGEENALRKQRVGLLFFYLFIFFFFVYTNRGECFYGPFVRRL